MSSAALAAWNTPLLLVLWTPIRSSLLLMRWSLMVGSYALDRKP